MTEKRTTKQHPNECPRCEGYGYTTETAAERAKDKDGKMVTTKIGSGCARCEGVGRLS